MEVETFADEWTLVALLSPGAALESARINGAAVQLVQRTEGLFWLAEKRQKATVQLSYHVDSRFSDRAYITSLPIPRAAATRFALQIPQSHIDLAVAPSANLITSETETGTTASGTVPATHSMMVSWRVAVEAGVRAQPRRLHRRPSSQHPGAKTGIPRLPGTPPSMPKC